jgi:hypothetical protein
MATSRPPKVAVFEAEWFYLDFTNLDARNHKVTSPATPAVRHPERPYHIYNCMAMAVGDYTRVWWPGGMGYWPRQPSEDTVDEVVDVLRADFGYEICNDGKFEKDFRKVAIFADANNLPQHIAFQPNQTGSVRRRWKSKMGNNVNIEHELLAVACKLYGSPVKFLRRPVDW